MNPPRADSMMSIDRAKPSVSRARSGRPARPRRRKRGTPPSLPYPEGNARRGGPAGPGARKGAPPPSFPPPGANGGGGGAGPSPGPPPAGGAPPAPAPQGPLGKGGRSPGGAGG